MDALLTLVAAYIQAHAVWLVTVIGVLFGLSEALPYFPNIEANNTVQLIVNIISMLKQKLSLKPAATAAAASTTAPQPPAAQ